MSAGAAQGRFSAQARPRTAIASIGLTLAIAVVAAPTPVAAGTESIVPAVGSYRASGEGDPSRYAVEAQVKRRAGRRKISVQVRDTCGGFATFASLAIGRSRTGVPKFSSQIGGARVSGRWTSATRIAGTVQTPCAVRQEYAMRLVR